MKALKRDIRKKVNEAILGISPEIQAYKSNPVLVINLTKKADSFNNRYLTMTDIRAVSILPFFYTPPMKFLPMKLLKTSLVTNLTTLAHHTASRKYCYVPRMNGDKLDFFQVYSENDINSFPPNKWNIREPPADDGRLTSYLCCA